MESVQKIRTVSKSLFGARTSLTLHFRCRVAFTGGTIDLRGEQSDTRVRCRR